jgi:hypothetical protein
MVRRSGGWVITLFSVLWLLHAPLAVAQPVVFSPAIAVRKAGEVFVALSVTGSGFGLPSGSAMLQVKDVNTGTIYSFTRSTQAPDLNLVVWSDTQIVVKLSPAITTAQVSVTVPPSPPTTWQNVDFYQYDSFDSNNGASLSAGTSPIPNAVVVDGTGRAWILEEFHRDLKYWDPGTSQVVKAPCAECGVGAANNIPHSSGTGAYETLGTATWTSGNGEDIILDNLGRVWFAQGGDGTDGQLPNHTRIISYNPALPNGQRFAIWNIPGDQNRTTHVAWDAVHGRLWFFQAARRSCGNGSCTTIHHARLVGFYPDANGGFLKPNNTYDFYGAATNSTCSGAILSTPPWTPGVCDNGTTGQSCFTNHDCVLINQICAANATWDFGCYHGFDLGDDNISFVAGTKVDAQGRVWFLTYISGSKVLNRLDPASGQVVRFPAGRSQHPVGAEFFFGPAAWDLDFATNGDVIFTEFFAGRISRFDISRVDQAECQQLDPNCTPSSDSTCNPCITSFTPPNYCNVDESGQCIEQPCGLFGGQCECEVVAGSCLALRDKSVKVLALHPDGTAWFTEIGPMQSFPISTVSIGFVDQQWQKIVLFPPLSLFNYFPSHYGFRPSGMYIAPGSPVRIWVTDMFQKQLGRLTKIG